MNSIISKLFVFIVETLSIFIIGVILITGLFIIFNGSIGLGLFVLVAGVLSAVLLLGFAALFVENYKNVRSIKDMLEAKMNG